MYKCHAMKILSFIIIMMIAYKIAPTIATSYISVSESLSDEKTLVSKGGQFELGFFSPGNSTRRYLGIWYKEMPIKKVVWVANRASPINNNLGTLTLSTTGNLIICQNDSVVWSTAPEKQAQKPIAELLDSGNLVIRSQGETDPEEGTYLWQSFDYPCDTILPGMKLGWDLRNGLERRITSWKSPDDPSPGDFSWGLVLHNYPEFFLMDGTQELSRIGPWNGLQFSGLSDRKQNPVYDFKYVANNDLNYASNKDEIFYSFTLKNFSAFVSATIYQNNFSISVWKENNTNWLLTETTPANSCELYGLCGPYASCSTNATTANLIDCKCLHGFIPKSTQGWATNDWSEGCVRNISLSCNNPQVDVDDLLQKYMGLKVPDTTHTLLYENIDLELCRTMCLNNCSCTAITNSDISGKGSGCVMWFGDLIDIRQFNTGGQDLYIRIGQGIKASNGNNKSVITIATTIAVSMPGMLLFCIYVIYRVRRRNADKSKADNNVEKHLEDLEIPLFDLQTITSATNNFSLNSKIGQGGFGSVYKGKLVDGQEIAVKRLSTNSGQGITEFLTEVKLIAKLQHRNLVKLLGCCVGRQEKLLVYEYMANGSLDSFIFDKVNGKLLDWPQRFQIIFGIARGLVYLHQDSRLRIIHRDLKASNVLLDDKLNPKISDFGMARSFGGDQIEGNTNRVVGTYGYMAPKYAVDGKFSIKSDVFSFGVLLLEIICGNKNRALCHGNETLNLVGYAWTLWKEGKAIELVELRIKDSCDISEVLRCIHVSLLCVQQYPEDRPTMSSIVLMLGSEMELVEPKEPGFFPRKISDEGKLCSSNQNEISSNEELTITSLNGR
ncbi:G-type lectin S-receptor serine/threonine-protein kinase [Trifolium repens]|nr:G-type lectin S-receptor serine/threonine-protein kinase [Trifolium repens]